MPRAVKMITFIAAVLLSISVTAVGAQEETETSSLESLSVTADSAGVDVSGKGLFTGPTTEVGTDATGDGGMPGSDLESAAVTQVTQTQLRFDLGVADLPPGLNGTPEGLNYVWPLDVSRNGQSSEVSLQAWRTSTAADLLCDVVFACPGQEPGGEPRFSVNTCAIDPDTGNNTCSSVGVAGEFTEDGLSWTVPASVINGQGGSTLYSAGAIAASYGASGLYWNTAGTGGDTMAWDMFEAPAPTVSLGIAPADTAAEDVPLTTSAKVILSSGNFSGTLEPPSEPGSYRVTAQACLGDSCGLASEIIEIS